MELPELLHSIDELQARIVAAGPLSPEVKRKLDYRFRLDWNYHSNVMEGSSLTQQETRSIMMGNVTVSGKPIKDVLEMQGHDELIMKLLGMAAGDINLSEARIREVHKAIVHEDDPVKQEQVGRWKTEGNFLTNYRGERFDFLPPAEVPEAMHELIDRTKAGIERIERDAKDAPHPALLAFRFHLDYVTIHPFHDGNGRTARIFSNLLLMRFGYPPVVIQVEEKETYNRYLAEVQAYGAPPDLFYRFIAERLIRAQNLVIDAIEGRSVEQVDDIDKEIALFKRTLESRKGAQEKRTVKAMLTLYEQSLRPLFKEFITSMDIFIKMFMNVSFIARAGRTWNEMKQDEVRSKLFDNVFHELMEEHGLDQHTEETRQAAWQELMNLNELSFTVNFLGFKHDGTNAFNSHLDLVVSFDEYTYSLSTRGDREPKIKHLYDEPLEKIERQQFLADCKKQILELIQSRMQHKPN